MSEECSTTLQVKNVKNIFNNMVDEYDKILDLWYRYTFGNINRVLNDEFRPPAKSTVKPVALDVGCGTGIQSITLASLGYRVIGFDVADALLRKARLKLASAGYYDSEFFIADAESLPISDCVADCVNCCGPTLSFVPNWRKALAEIGRCLKPGGILLLEVEGKWSLDLIWEIINAFGCNFLGYDESLLAAMSHLLPPWNVGHTIKYSFKLESGEVTMPLKLFACKELKKELKNIGLIRLKQWGLHSVTNIVPSVILHKQHPNRKVKAVFRATSYLERHIYGARPFNCVGNSILVVARKKITS